MKKVILVVLDGLGDLKYSALGNKTPFEYADAENLHRLSYMEINHVDRKIVPESDFATMKMFGYDDKDYPGRGALEALGLGIKSKSIFFRGNFCTVDNSGRIVKNRTFGSIKKSLRIDGVKIKIHGGESYRCVVEFSGKDLYYDVSNTDPNYRKIPHKNFSSAVRILDPKIKKCKAFDKKSERFAQVVNKFTEYARENIKGEANAILLRDGGMIKKVKSFSWKMLAVTNRVVEKGIARLIGIDIKSPKVYGRPEDTIMEDSKEQLKILSKNFEKYDVFYLFNKAPDVYSHAGDLKGKINAIEQLDKYLIGPVVKKFHYAVICVTADHSTPCKYKTHSSHPVPLIHNGLKFEKDSSLIENLLRNIY